MSFLWTVILSPLAQDPYISWEISKNNGREFTGPTTLFTCSLGRLCARPCGMLRGHRNELDTIPSLQCSQTSEGYREINK